MWTKRKGLVCIYMMCVHIEGEKSGNKIKLCNKGISYRQGIWELIDKCNIKVYDVGDYIL